MDLAKANFLAGRNPACASKSGPGSPTFLATHALLGRLAGNLWCKSPTSSTTVAYLYRENLFNSRSDYVREVTVLSLTTMGLAEQVNKVQNIG